MRKMTLTLMTAGLIALAIVCLPGTLRAQEGSKTPPPATEKPAKILPVYRLEFTVREVEDGKRLNSRSYVMSVEEGDWGRIRVGNRIPYNTGKDSFQYYDVGINIDCKYQVRDDSLLLGLGGIDISSIVKDDTSGSTPNPVVRRARAEGTAVVVPGKPTLVTSLDDVSSNRRYEVEVLATKVK